MTLYIIAGANGSGKTTFAKLFSNKYNLNFINADEIAKELDENNIIKYKIKAGKIFFQHFNQALDGNESFIIETTLSGKYLIKYIEKAKKLKFKVIIMYMFLDHPQTNISRVKNRVLNGGHHIPEEDIIRRFYRSKHMFWNVYKKLVDEWILYYNADEIFTKIANNEKILDDIKFKKFIEDDLK